MFCPLERPDRLWGPPSISSNRHQVSPGECRGWSVKLITHLQLVPELKMCGAIAALPYAP
jgi:hypothetical protein